MSKQVLKVFNYLKKIILWSVYSGIIIALSGCGDFVEETVTGACNQAIDERDYNTALSACTSRLIQNIGPIPVSYTHLTLPTKA